MVAVDPPVAESIAKCGGAGLLRAALPALKAANINEPMETSKEHSARGDTLLSLAARAGNTEAARLLLQEGANVDARTKYEATPLYLACQENRLQLAKLLLDAKARVNNKDDGALTPLMIASHQGHAECVKLLLAQKNVVVDLPSPEHGLTALLKASFLGHDKVVAALLDAKADVGHADKDGASALILACRNGHGKCVRLLLKAKAAVDEPVRNEGGTALHFAAKAGSAECVKHLLGSRALTDLQAGEGRVTPLHLASQGGHIDVARLLLEARCDPEALDKDSVPPLFYADTRGHTAVSTLLASFGANRAHGNDPKTVWALPGTPGTKAPSPDKRTGGDGGWGLW